MSVSESIARLQELIAARPDVAASLRGAADPAALAVELARIAAENGIPMDAMPDPSGELSEAQLDRIAGGETGMGGSGDFWGPSLQYYYQYGAFPSAITDLSTETA